MSTPADDTDNTTTSVATLCFPMPDPLLFKCTTAGLPAWVDQMLDELVALLIVSLIIGATAPVLVCFAGWRSGCPVDDELASVIAYAGIAIGHAATTGRSIDIPQPQTRATTPPWPMSPARGNIDDTTPGDATIVAAMDGVNRTPSPKMTLVDRSLKRFTKRIKEETTATS